MKNKKTFTKLISIFVLVACIALSAFGCGGNRPGRDDDEQVDVTKSRLDIGSWNGDFHLTWLEEIADRFEEEYKDYSFEEGKKGVQVWVNQGNYAYTSGNILNDSNDIVVSEQGNYYGFVNDGSGLDITDAITTPLTEYGETKSIADKMDRDVWDYYGVGTSENANGRKYYGVPWYETYTGFNYDIAYFREENLYLAAEGQGRDGFVVNEKTTKSNGPDGVPGTSDDGLPATYDEFFMLLDKMYEIGMEPVAWGGNAQVYLNNLLMAFVADYEGYDSMRTCYDFYGNTQVVSKINDDGTLVLEDIEVTPANGYKLKQLPGYYYGLKFIERLLTTKDSAGIPKYYDPNHSINSQFTHRAVQSNFLRAGYVEDVKTRIGILIDASWWHSGAEEIFKMMSSIPGGAANEREFGFMPLPKADESRLGEATYLNNWMSNITVRGNISDAQAKIAKAFIRFMHTDVSLSEFTRLTGAVRPFDYELTAEDLPLTTVYGMQQMEIHNNAKIVNPWSTTPIMLNNYSAMTFNETVVTTVVSSGSWKLVSEALRSGVTAKEYFEGLKVNYSQANWNNSFSKYFD